MFELKDRRKNEQTERKITNKNGVNVAEKNRW